MEFCLVILRYIKHYRKDLSNTVKTGKTSEVFKALLGIILNGRESNEDIPSDFEVVVVSPDYT